MRSSPWTPTERIAGQHGEALPELAVEPGAADLLEQDRVGLAEDVEPLAGDLADDPDPEARARERVAPDHRLGQAELLPHAPHLVLEERAQRLDELHGHVLGETADVVVRLDLRGDALGAARLDHVRVERALDEEAASRRCVSASSSKTRMNSSPMMRRFSSGSVDALEPREEAVGGVDVHERDVEVPLEGLDDLRRLVLPHQPVVDEDAGQLVADRLVDEQRGDG